MHFTDVLKSGVVSVAFQWNPHLELLTAIALPNHKAPSLILERLNREPGDYSWHSAVVQSWFHYPWFPYVEAADMRQCLERLTLKMSYVREDNYKSYLDIVDKHTTAYFADKDRRLVGNEMIDTMHKAIRQYSQKEKA